MSAVPYSVSRLLTRAIVRVRRGILMRGAATVGIVWVVGVVAAMLVDARWVIFDDRIRWAMSTGVVALVVVAVVAAVILPLRRRLDFRKIARALDARHPELEERLSALVELSEVDARKAGYSASLFDMLGRLAENDVPKIDLVREFPFRRALRALMVFVALLVVLVAGVALSPGLVGRLFVRAVAPWVDVGNLRANDVSVSPGDLVALAGSVIRIEAKVDESLHASPTIRISRRRGALWSEETTEPMADGVYETTADVAEREWRYRVNAGPAVTRYYYVRVSEPPRYDSFTARVDYPDYTHLPPVVYSNDEVSAIRAIEGSRVSFALAVSEPGTVADFKIGDRPVFEHVMQSNRTVSWSLDLVNRDGFRTEKGAHPLTSCLDQPPTIVVESPSTRLPALPPYAKIQVELTASDDVGVRPPELRCGIDDEEMRTVGEIDEFVLTGGNLWRGKTEIDLSRLDLSYASRVRFDFVVRDERPDAFGGAQAATSSVINVSIASHEWGLQVSDLREQTRALNSMIDDAKSRLQTAEQLASQLKNDFRRDGRVSEDVERKNERAAYEASEAEKRLTELRDRMEKDDRFAPVVRALEKTVSDLVAPARDKAENSPFQDRGERAAEMEKASEELKAAREKMDEITQRMRERAEQIDTFEKVRDLADRQEALARSAHEILAERPKDTNRLEAWKRLEEETMRRADELANKRPGIDLNEARRKMETAAREIDDMKKELADAERRAAAEKAAAEARTRQDEALAVQREQSLSRAAEAQKRAEQALADNSAVGTEQSQRQAEEELARGEALPGVKAVQREATEAARQAAAEPASEEKKAEAVAAQRRATEALAKERELRAALKEGKAKPTDLAKLDTALRQEYAWRQAAAKAKAAAEAPKPTPAEIQQAEARQQAAVEQRRAREAQETKDAAATADAQRKAEDAMNRGNATKGAKDLQQAASAAERTARQHPRNEARAELARAAQRTAAEAFAREQQLREEIGKGEKTSADLEALDRELQQVAKDMKDDQSRQDEAFSRQERKTAERAARQDQSLREAGNQQKNALQMQKDAAVRRESERSLRQQNNTAAADAKCREAEMFEKRAAGYQKAAEDYLERAEAAPAVKALQRQATKAQRDAQRMPKSAEKAEAARMAQQAASDALQREKALREAIAKGEKSAEDLAAFERELSDEIRKQAVDRAASARQKAERAVAAAREAVGEAEDGELVDLAGRALQARREAVAAELAERELAGDALRAEALRDAERRLDAMRAAADEESAREDRILALQQQVVDAVKRNDRGRPYSLFPEIARLQSRAAERLESEEAEVARRAATAEQAAARATFNSTLPRWNDETKAAAVAAEEAAMAHERVAQAEARAERAMNMMAAAERETGESSTESGEPSAEASQPVTEAADAATDAMRREVKSQAAELGIPLAASRSGQDQGRGCEKGEQGEESSGGGDVRGEVDRLARDLKRTDSPDFFKQLFTRLGWFKINGLSKKGLTDEDLKDVPREYRDLVRLYFLKLADEGKEK